MNRKYIWLARFLVFVILSSLAIMVVNAEGTLTISPTNDFHSGRGSSFNLDVNERIRGKWYSESHLNFTNVETYRDTGGTFNVIYAYNKRLELGAGYGHEKFEQYGDNTFEANDVHTLVRINLW